MVGANETDPHNPDTNQDGRLDGEELAGWSELWDKYYGCTNKWDYTVPTEGRHPKFPDTTVRMQWNHRGRSWMDVDCDYHECQPPDPPPEFVVGERRERRWTDLSCNYGTESIWFTNHAGQVYGGDPMSYFALFPIPRERCVPFIGNELVLESAILDPPMAFTVRRSAWTDVRLSVGQSTWPKPRRSVVVRLTAVDKTDGQSLGAGDTGCDSNEPNSLWLGREIDPVHREVRVDGRRVDVYGQVLIQVPRNGYKDVTPTVPNCTWYMYALSPAAPKTVRLTWSRHPLLTTVPDVQAGFDEGARLLADDDDERIRNPTAPDDDVPVYVEFVVFPARNKGFPNTWTVFVNGQWKTISPASAEFKRIGDPGRVNELLAADFANVKIVEYIGFWVPDPPNGPKYLEPLGITWRNHPSCVLVSTAPAVTTVHEWGHMAGCEDSDRPGAVMYRDNRNPAAMVEINVTEARQMEGYTNWLWGL